MSALRVVLARHDSAAHARLAAENLRWAARAAEDAEDADAAPEICNTRCAFALLHFLQAFARPEGAR